MGGIELVLVTPIGVTLATVGVPSSLPVAAAESPGNAVTLDFFLDGFCIRSGADSVVPTATPIAAPIAAPAIIAIMRLY